MNSTPRSSHVDHSNAAPRDRIENMTRLLRGLGALLLLVSASSFLLQHWQTGHDLLRYGFLLAHSALLIVAAFLSGRSLADSRSARLFLWTALALLPATFTVLGGLVYSQFAADGALTQLPDYAIWQAPSAGAALGAVAATLLLAWPVAWLAARVLVRRQAALISGAFVALNLLLVAPVRSSAFAGLLAVVGLGTALSFERRLFRKEWSLATLEGRLVRALFWVPTGIVMARSAIFYPSSINLLGVVGLALGSAGFLFARDWGEHRRYAGYLELCAGWLTAGSSWLLLSDLSFAAHLGPWPLLAVPAALALLASWARRRSALVSSALLSLCAVVGIGLVDDQELWTGALAICCGAAVLAASVLTRRRVSSVTAVTVLLAGIAIVFERAIGFDHIANWGTLSGLGVLLVFAAAFAERSKDRLAGWLDQFEVGARHTVPAPLAPAHPSDEGYSGE